ncbi:MAG: EAL domain-containing protein [Actinomycetota bacterium]|nr:EAL domain-containing protein [Actinomycetota bacterium]
MESLRDLSGPSEMASAAHLRAMLDLARLLRADARPPEVMTEVARIVSQALGFETVVINLYREDGDAYEVVTVHGNDRARALLLGDVTPAHTWAPMLDPGFEIGGSFFVPAGTLEWDQGIRVYIPEATGSSQSAGTSWHPEDALFATLDGAGGRHYGIISVDEPRDGLRPDEGLLEVLSAIAAHAAQTFENASRFGQLRSALQRHRAVIEHAQDGVIAIDAQGRVLEFNPAAERIFGYRTADVIGHELATLIIAPEDRDAHRRGLARGFATGDWRLMGRRVEMTGVRATGERLPVELSLTVIKDAEEGTAAVYGFIRDISERRRGEEQLAFLAYHDPLTGLPNRVLVEQQVELALARARRSATSVALMFVDLDDFKDVNDRLGHAAGDQLLTGVAARLRGVLRDSDVLARQGGDEFLILITDLSDDAVRSAEMVGTKVLGSLHEPFVVGTAEVRTGASIGISLFPADATDAEALLRHADAAMYRAKGQSGGRLAFHQPTGNSTAKRTSVSSQLRNAMTDAELELHYLPIWSVDPERRIDGVEALLRWRHPDRGLLRPGSFMDLADQSAVADDVMDWVLDEVCRHAAGWRAAGLDPRVSLNMSHGQLLAENFAARFVTILAEHGLEPGRFLIELTESAWTVGAEETLAVVAELRGSGTTFAIDDFGAGYSSLSRLRERSFDVIKIDRTLIADVPDGRTTDAVLSVMVELARACDAEIIAEGVERAEQLAFLIDNGISLMQGYLFGQPLPVSEITELLQARLPAGRLTA